MAWKQLNLKKLVHVGEREFTPEKIITDTSKRINNPYMKASFVNESGSFNALA